MRAHLSAMRLLLVVLVGFEPSRSLRLSGRPAMTAGKSAVAEKSAPERVLVTAYRVEAPLEPPSSPPPDADVEAEAPDYSPLPRSLPTACLALASDQGCATVNGKPVPPDSCVGGYYGHDSSLDPEWALEQGLKGRGDDWDLVRHAMQAGNSAFRGTTKLVTYPDGVGAAAWADEGGYVYELCCVPSWDVNQHIQGRRLVSDMAVGRQRYAGNLAFGEHEHAVPARVPTEHIKRYGRVVISAGGLAYVPRNAWVENPRFDPAFCRYSLSECGACDHPAPCLAI